MDYRATLQRLTQLWREGTPVSRQAFEESLAMAEHERGEGGSLSARGHLLEGGTLEHLVWGGFFQTLADSESQNDETIEEIVAYVTYQRPYSGRAYIDYDFRPDMSEALLGVYEEAAAFFRTVQDQEYMERAERDDLESQRAQLVTSWRELPQATTWKQRTVCAQVLSQVFHLLISQMYLPGQRVEVWARAPYSNVMDTTKQRNPNLLALVPWGQRTLGALMGTDLAQLAWHFEEGHIAFSLMQEGVREGIARDKIGGNREETTR